ncbi:MAG: hypothetical protein NVSMB21_02740 [Vulcanimicrobiaceae bacterium]
MTTIHARFVRTVAAASLVTATIATPHAFAAPGPAAAPLAAVNKTTPEFDAFRHAWDGVINYSETIVAHETTNDGKATVDRTYRYEFVKPSAALIVITAGPGKGGGAAWHGGPTIRGHKGGFASFIKMTLAKDDPRATSLRGDQIDVASYGYVLERFASVPGTLSESRGPAGTSVALTMATPDRTGITREILTLSPTMHLPIEHQAFVGDKLVKHETFADIKLNDPSLTAAKIDI